MYGLAVAYIWGFCLIDLCSLLIEGEGFKPQGSMMIRVTETTFGRKHPGEGSVSIAARDVNSPRVREDSRSLRDSLTNGVS